MAKSKSYYKKDWAGNKYTEHWKDGKKTGTSYHKKDWAGNKYTEHWKDDKKTGTSYHKKDWAGNSYSDNYFSYNDNHENKQPISKRSEGTCSSEIEEISGIIILLFSIIFILACFYFATPNNSPNTNNTTQYIKDPQLDTAIKQLPASPLLPGRYIQNDTFIVEYYDERLRVCVTSVDITEDEVIAHLQFTNESNIPSKYLIGNGVKDNIHTGFQKIDIPTIEDKFGNKYSVVTPVFRGSIQKFSFNPDQPNAWGGVCVDKFLGSSQNLMGV